MAADSSENSISQLELTRDFLRDKLVEVDERFNDNPRSGIDGSVTFAMAQRNFIQGNLERVERQLLLARVSSSSAAHHDTVGIGNVVYIQRGSDIRAIMIIPPAGADPDVEYVSAASPIGKALLGKRKGGDVEIKTALGKQNYGILRIA